MLRFIIDKYIYVVAACLFFLALSDLRETWKSKRYIKFIMLLVVIGVTVTKPIYEYVTYVPVVQEIFTDGKNIEYLERADNIIFKTTEPIIEPIDLRVKDTYIHLTYLTDYDVKNDKKTVIINYPFGNNKETNRDVAKRGLVFTYKTIRKR